MRLLFSGTAEFAVPSLEALHQAGHQIVGVITAPDKPAGRGLLPKGSPVKEAALRLGLPILQPDKLKNPDFLAQVAALDADLGIVVAFRMMPEALWAMPRLGTVNLHGSLLPQYRGAAPIHWAVANGETRTGVTTFFLQHEIDTGDLILQDSEPIHPEDTTGNVYLRLMACGAALITKTVAAIEAGQAPRTPQAQIDVAQLHHAPKITPENSQVHWAQPREAIRNLIRGMAPSPIAWAMLAGQRVRLYKATHYTGETPALAPPGTLTVVARRNLIVACADGWLTLEELQLEGKKRITGQDAINGRFFGEI